MRTQTRKPTHPGNILKHDYLIPLNLTFSDLATLLNITDKLAKEIINGEVSINEELAYKLAYQFDSTPELWINLQTNYDSLCQ